MTSKRFFFVMVGIVGLLGLGMVGSTLLANNMLKSKAKELTDLKLENKVIESQQASIGQARKDIDKYADLEQIAKSAVPQQKDQAKAVLEIVKIAQDSGIRISSITFPSSNLGEKAPVPAAGSTTPAKPKSSTAITQVKAVDGIPGVYQMDLSVQTASNSSVTFAQLIGFLDRLEQNRRTSQVSTLSITPSKSRLTFNLSIRIYIKP